MEITVLVEQVSGNGFRAVSGEPLCLEADASTREDVLLKLQELIEKRLKAGAEVVRLRIPDSEHPLAAFAGMLKDDPLVPAWKEAMSEYREQQEQ